MAKFPIITLFIEAWAELPTDPKSAAAIISNLEMISYFQHPFKLVLILKF